MRLWSRTAYLGVTGALSVVAGATAAGLEVGSSWAVAAGLATAWVLQAPSFWWLAGTLARGEAVLREWVAGMALRLGGLAVIAAVGATTGLPAADAAIAYVGALLVHLGLEVVWLFRRQPDSARGGRARGETRQPAPGPGSGTGRDDADDSIETPKRAAGRRSGSR